ncbi:sugar hydrolase [Streptomyces zinciresistens K42]|uniref:Sugar hydrolase n=1 Tax=Streptomyces zinciresistens K42 TaxID=700597 RepID=G2G4E1_9ACTN|nr:chitinase [Streptomyces zinciresistens]EGX61616.1 sugar hydrolase [Streptomyces zinciresistens K42]
MHRYPGPAAALLAGLLALTTACSAPSGGADAAPPATAAPSSGSGSPGTSYAPYVNATRASGLDSAGSPAVYNLAFVISDGSACTPLWHGVTAVTDAAAVSRVRALTDGGAAVRVSFGGAAGTELAATCDSAPALARAYGEALDAAGATRADFDIEGEALTDSASLALRSEAIALLQRERPGLQVSFTLPVMPDGLDAAALALLASANRADVQVSTVNIMTMNYAESYDGDMGDYALAAARAAHAQLRRIFGTSDATAWKALALTSMLGVNDVGGETFTLQDAAQVRAFAAEKGIGWVSVWASFRDRPCAPGASSDDPATNCSGVRQEAGAFAEALSG